MEAQLFRNAAYFLYSLTGSLQIAQQHPPPIESEGKLSLWVCPRAACANNGHFDKSNFTKWS
jgi:hypothetical protein